jgi:hypothetical protein
MNDEELYDTFEKFAKHCPNGPAWAYFQGGYNLASDHYRNEIAKLNSLIESLTLDIEFIQQKK